jgi:DNA-binding winged helix-turn-helix (wHTH) protein
MLEEGAGVSRPSTRGRTVLVNVAPSLHAPTQLPLPAATAVEAKAAIAFGEFRLDPAQELVIGPEGPRPLRRQAFAVLALLLERAPALVTLDELLDTVWGRHAISPSAVPQAIRDVRRALGDDAEAPRYIETRHRRGYRCIAPISRASAEQWRIEASVVAAVAGQLMLRAGAAANDGLAWAGH